MAILVAQINKQGLERLKSLKAQRSKAAFRFLNLVALLTLLTAGCTHVPASVVDPLKGNQPYDQADGDEPMDLREGKPVYIWPVSSPDGKRIVFVSNRDGNTELYVMDADGSNPVNLTRNRADDGNGSYEWSPDGNRIVFSSMRRGDWDIYTVRPDGRDLRRLTNSSAQDYNPVWSPDGQWIAFASNRSGSWQIHRMRADGTGMEALTRSPEDNDAPVYSPDGRNLAFISNRTGSWDIFKMPSGGGDPVALTDFPSGEDHPRWSSDGRRIIFESDKDGNWEIYTMRSDGTNLVRLTQTPAAESSPVYSPNMKHVAFSSYRDGNPEIYVMNADGSGQTRLTFDPGNDICPYWSPDGTKIYFSSNRGGREEIFAIRMADYQEIPISHVVGVPTLEDGSHGTGGYFEAHPVWSRDSRNITFTAGGDQEEVRYIMDLETGRIAPAGEEAAGENHPGQTSIHGEHPVRSHNGTRVAFESNRDGNWDIYVAALDGSNPKRLTDAPGADIHPAWSPEDDRIAFTSHRDGKSAIYIMDREGRNQKAVVRTPARLPAWSWDGKSLFFVSEQPAHEELHRINLETGETVVLTSGEAGPGTRVWHPVVSPDGRWIAYVSNATGDYRVWISTPTGSEKRLLTRGPDPLPGEKRLLRAAALGERP